MKINRKIVNFFMGLCLSALLGYAVWLSKTVYENLAESNRQMLYSAGQQASLTRTYHQWYFETKSQLALITDELTLTKNKLKESQDILTGVSRDLQETRSALSQAAMILSEATQGKVALPPEILALSQNRSSEQYSLDSSILSLQEKNEQLAKEMRELRNQLRQFSGDVRSLDEGKAVLGDLHKRIKTVKSKISYYKREADGIRIAALRERDRVRSMIGNNGFLVRNGQSVNVDMQQYHAGKLNPDKTDEITSKSRKTQIDVTFFK